VGLPNVSCKRKLSIDSTSSADGEQDQGVDYGATHGNDKRWKNKRWNKQYEKLVKFKRKRGHCIVPKRYPQDLSLGKWVGTQRSNHAKNTMPQARTNLLNKLGFVWKVFGTVAARSSTTRDDVSCLSWMVPFSIYYSGPFFSHSRCVSAFKLIVCVFLGFGFGIVHQQ
jgi:hypothetical protein